MEVRAKVIADTVMVMVPVVTMPAVTAAQVEAKTNLQR